MLLESEEKFKSSEKEEIFKEEVKVEEKIAIDVNNRVSIEFGELVSLDKQHQEISSFNKFLTTIHEEYFNESVNKGIVFINKNDNLLGMPNIYFGVTSLKYQMKKYFFTL